MKAALAGAVIAVGGMVAGMQLAGQPAEAQAGGYTLCFVGVQEHVDIDSRGAGGAGVGHGYVLFCRR